MIDCAKVICLSCNLQVPVGNCEESPEAGISSSNGKGKHMEEGAQPAPNDVPEKQVGLVQSSTANKSAVAMATCSYAEVVRNTYNKETLFQNK